ncbi:TPA: pentapeptide repeat-containing protein [Campylobacter lari]|uniref:pentapeptide repeat-containing protein n=1 Tax=Campylobacter sp. FU_497 TaxID=2911610 RepID=UPI0021E65A1D|nr:pentapeptide repeat-containing protein [Campylobacter sp. FU_497]MCV3462706.1 pentapeptide repeat-containing protein [Campylobacter sp. FU_497]HEC1758756.1 pentapeptide repeat-containing protein [Campylobacter lari]
MCKIVLDKNMQDFLLQQIEKEIPLEIFLDTQVNKEILKKDIYDRVVNAFEGYQRYGMKKDINKDILKEKAKKISYEITSKKILSKELEIDENYIFVGTDIIIISHQESFPYDEDTENLIKKQSDERLVIKKADIRLFSQFPLHFIRCDFQCEIKNTFWNYLECENLSFENCNFYKEVYFGFQKKFKLLIMENCYFHNKVYFSGAFNENALFNNSHFKDYVDFHECEFEKTACFYGVQFDEIPNFSQVVFKESVNLVNIKANFDFRNLNIAIKNINKLKDEAANDFRDYFRIFKNILIKDNNLLDASKFHKYELYCKEIELEEKKSKIFSKEWIDKWQLVFYRKLCDHHTDLLKVFHNLLIIVKLFSVFSFVLDKFKQPSIENHAKYHIVQVDTNESYIFKEHNKTTYNFLSLNIEQEFKNLDNLLSKTEIYFSLGFVLLVTFVALLNKQYLWFLLLPLFVGVVYCVEFPMSIIAHFMIIMLFACTFVFIMVFDSKPERFLFVSVSYIVCIFTLLAKPSLMLPVFGSFLEKDSNATYPLLLSLSVVYFILVALVIFSLQKTARKNSVVPS